MAAGDFVGSSKTSPELVPGKRNLVQSTSLGNAYGDHGAKCDRKGPETPGCFMTDDARKRYFDLFGFLVGGARENFKAACTSLQVKEFLKKEEELDWFTSLVLDFASTFLIGAAAKGLKYLKNAGANALVEKGVEMIDRGADATLYDRADALVRGVTDKRIESWSRTAFYTVKKGAQAVAKDAKNSDAREQKTDVDGYLNSLKNSCDLGYNNFLTQVLSGTSDAEFAVVWEGMQPENHFQQIYEAALTQKLNEYKSSRIRDIGRKITKDESGHLTMLRETRVVWVKNYPGSGQKLYYQYQEGAMDSLHASAEDPGRGWGPAWIMRMLPPEFGVLREASKLGSAVPEQLVELAIERSEGLYGPTVTLDPVRDYLTSHGHDLRPLTGVPRVDLKPNPNAPSYSVQAGQPPGPLPLAPPGTNAPSAGVSALTGAMHGQPATPNAHGGSAVAQDPSHASR